MIAAIKSELVQRKWLNDEDFVDIITLAQTAPGLFAVNISILTGHRLRGTKGSVVATIASCLPPFLIILLVAIFFANIRHNHWVDAAFRGMRPAVVALIIAPIVGLTRGMRWWMVSVALATAVVVWHSGISPVWFLIGGAMVGLLCAARKGKGVDL